MFKFMFLLCVIFFTGTHYVAGTPNSNYVYNQQAKAWLRLHVVPATWSDAGMRCQLEGGVLASPTSSAMAQAMSTMMTEHELTRNVFTGINSILVRENFTTLEGMPLSSIPLSWAPGEPDNANADEDCVAMTGARKLADTSCESVLPYFCSKKGSHGCGSGENDHTDARTGSCYRYHSPTYLVRSTWREALAKCHSAGGYLAIINSQTEATVLQEILVKEEQTDHTYVGFRQYYDGEWATIHGDTLAEAGYSEWSPQEPNNVSGKETCGSIFPYNGKLNDAQCNEPRAYICEFTTSKIANTNI